MKTSLLSFFSIFLLAFLSSNAIQAANAIAQPIIITASRTPQAEQDVLAATSVVTRTEIEAQQFQSIAQALQTLPGISVSNQGGNGKLTSIFLRGSNANHILVLIDGIQVGSVTAGTTAFQDLPIASVERIELVRGPLSSLYGAEAIGGVLQIFTRKAQNTQEQFQLSATAGSYGTYQGNFVAQTSNDKGWASYQLSQEKTDGINSCKGSFTRGCFTIEPDKDGYSQQAHNLGFGWKLTDTTQAAFHWLRSDANNDYDGSFQNKAKNRQQVFSSQINTKINPNWSASWMLGQSEDNSRNLLAGVEKSKFNTQKNSAAWLNKIKLNQITQLTLGLDYLQDEVNESSSLYAKNSRNNQGLFALIQIQDESYSWELSGRQDHNQQFGNYNTGTLRWGMNLPQNTRLSFSWGNAFKAPTFNDLYYDDPNDPFYHGNPNLVPEKSQTKEIGFQYLGFALPWSINLFQTDFSDLIALNNTFDSSINLSSAQATGLEMQGALRFNEIWQLSTQITLLNSQSKDAVTEGNWLPRRSREQINIDLSRKINKLSLGAQVFAQGKRYDNLANTTQLSGYGLINLRAEYSLNKCWKLQTRIENLLNKEYETIAEYNQPGRGVFVSVNYNGM